MPQTTVQMKKKWTPPAPMRDPPGNINPWPDDIWVPRISGDAVAFIDEGHQYFLQDDHRAYPCHIISGSKMIKYWEAYVKVQSCGCIEETDPIVQVGRVLAQDNINRQQDTWTKRHKISDEIDEGDIVPVIREMFTTYINEFASYGILDMSFSQRAAKLQQCSPVGDSFPHHTKHRALRVCEEWILAPCDNKPTPDIKHDEGWTDFLRYLCHPSNRFSSVKAMCIHSKKPLSEFLEQEWIRCGSPAGVSKQEANIVKYNVPTMAGVTAHRYIECLMNPARGTPPELYEHEDSGCLTLMFDYLKQKKIEFSPENIEKRVGSKLYKFCGTMDAFRKRPDNGIFEVWDWKRSSHAGSWLDICTQPDPDDMHWVVVDTSKVTFSSALMTYFLQASAYRQLEMLSHPENVVSTSAFLGVFHPNLDRKFVIVEMHLDEKMQSRALVTSKGITTYIDSKTGEEVECTDGATPIQYVECFMYHRLEHLKRHFKCEPNMGS